MAKWSRRKFVKTVVAASSCMNSLGAWASHENKMFTSLSCETLGVKANQREAMDLAYHHGFQAVEPLTKDLTDLSDDDLKHLVEELHSKNLRWGTAHINLTFESSDEAFATGMKNVEKSARALQNAGVTRIYRALLPASDDLTYTQNFNFQVKHITEMATVMEDHGLRLGLEYCGVKTLWAAQRFPFVHTMQETRELIAATGKKNVGFNLNAFHWYAAHETAADLSTLTTQEIVSVDVSDAKPGIPVDQQVRNARELPCATGVIDLSGFINALSRVGYQGPVRANTLFRVQHGSDDEAVSAAADSLRQLFALVH